MESGIIDWRFALELVAPTSEYGWRQPGDESKHDINGKYEYIEWRDSSIPQPSESELQRAWENYVATNGTPEQQQADKDVARNDAILRLREKAKLDADVADLLELVLG